MKKKVTEFIQSLGGSAEYSGNTKTMFINDPKQMGIEEQVIKTFGENLPFSLKTN